MTIKIVEKVAFNGMLISIMLFIFQLELLLLKSQTVNVKAMTANLSSTFAFSIFYVTLFKPGGPPRTTYLRITMQTPD